ncbi:Ion transport domain [Dillenia turbinata]|uniref:Ion transport domain n=1 Tax=Dillenia turbinata TaxID=194707 RepID=A0AAN8US33_9MAGN
MLVVLLLVLAADISVYGLFVSMGAIDSLPFRIAPYIRVAFFVLNIRELRSSLLILAGMLSTYINVLGPTAVLVMLSETDITIIFVGRNLTIIKEINEVDTGYISKSLVNYDSEGEQASIASSFLLFLVIRILASRWYCLIFVLYVLLGVYFVTNLILAVVYDSFKNQLAIQVAEMDSMRRRILEKAFNLLDEYVVELSLLVWLRPHRPPQKPYLAPRLHIHLRSSDLLRSVLVFTCHLRNRSLYGLDSIFNNGYLDKDQCLRLFVELNKYRTLPRISREDFELIFDELDDSHDFKINLDEFADLCNAIALRFQKEDVPSCFENCPSVYYSPSSEKLKTFVRSSTFEHMIASILILNFVTVIVETTLDIEDSSAQSFWQGLEFIFGWLYVLEMVLKVYAYGFMNYWRDGQNRFDFLVTWIIAAVLWIRLIGETATFLAPNDVTFLSNGEWIRYLLIARMLRLIRLLLRVPQYRAFVATFITLIPSLMPYLGTIFSVMCIYCSLSVQIFGGIVNAGNKKLDTTDLAEDEYPLIQLSHGELARVDAELQGFNRNKLDTCILYQLLPDNGAASIELGKPNPGISRTLTFLQCRVVAFVLEAFFAEMELESSEQGEEQAKVQEGRRNDRRRLAGTKTRSLRVEALLHHMLSAELNQKLGSNA